MKKQTLLTAVALGTIAMAGAANAADITAAKIGGTTLDFKDATTLSTTAYSLASELDVSKGIESAKAGNLVTLTVSKAQTELLGGNYVVTFKTTGAEFKLADVTTADVKIISADADCAKSTISVSTLAANEVSFLVAADAAKCVATKGITAFTFAPTLTIKANGSTTITGGITSGGTAIDGGTSKAITLIDSKAAFATTITATQGTQALLTKGFTTLAGGTIGNIKVDLAAYTPADVVYKDGNGTAADATKDVATTTAIITSSNPNNLTTKVGAVSADDTKVNPQTFKLGAGVVNSGVTVAVTDSKGTAVQAGTFSATVKVTLAAGFNTPADTTAALGSITREGTAYLIPWVGSGTTAQASGNQTVIRISNIGTTATGLVSAELLTSSTGAGAVGAFLPINGSIAAGKDFVITGASLQSNFGADFGRGDVRITVEGLAANLVTRRFIQNVAAGALTEVSLGRTAGNLTGGIGAEPVN